MTREERDLTRTLNGKFDCRCVTCGLRVYCMWVGDEPPAPGCDSGFDSEPWKCSHVYNRLVFAVIWEDHTHPGEPLHPAYADLIARIGPKAREIMADIRAGKEPPEHKPNEPNYDLARPQ